MSRITSALLLLLTVIPTAGPASARDGGRWGGRLAAGVNFPGWEGSSPFFYVDVAGTRGLSERLDVELCWTFGFLRQEDRRQDTGGVFFSFLQPGARYRLTEGRLAPYVAAHLGLAIAHGDLQIGGEDASETSVGLALDLRAGLAWTLDERWALDVFLAYARATNVVTPASDFDDTAGVGVVLLGAGVAFRD